MQVRQFVVIMLFRDQPICDWCYQKLDRRNLGHLQVGQSVFHLSEKSDKFFGCHLEKLIDFFVDETNMRHKRDD